jgi:hypothetical protein
MRQTATPSLCHQKHRLQKHLKKSKAARKRKNDLWMNKRKLKPLHLNISSDSILGRLNVSSMTIDRKFKGSKDDKLIVKVPRFFSIYDEPVKSLNWLFNTLIPKVLNTKKCSIFLDQTGVVNWSLGSEFLLGVIAKELKQVFDVAGQSLHVSGQLTHDNEYKQIVKQLGVVERISGFTDFAEDHSTELHVFKADGNFLEEASADANDRRQHAVTDFMVHLKKCFSQRKMELTADVCEKIELCLAEILDNAIEHNGESRPEWYVRSFLSNKSNESSNLDLTVMNFGNSISSTFANLDSLNISKKHAMEYVDLHVGQKFSKDSLLTVAALQSSMSCKNDGIIEKTRGMGSINLIESFEGLFRDYKAIMKVSDDACKMNIISGGIIIKFDGTYSMISDISEDGSEKVIVPFNKEGTLQSPPDSKYVSTMNGVEFPGVMINIRVPLKGISIPQG